MRSIIQTYHQLFSRINVKATYVLMFIFFYLAHINLDYYGDDYVFKSFFAENGFLQSLEIRWNTWSSRLIIESVLMLFSQSFYIWKIANSLVLVVLVYALTVLTYKTVNSSRLFFVFLLIHLYPFKDMYSAGWIATSINYLWPLTFMLLSFVPLKRLTYANNTTHKKLPFKDFFYFLGAVFAVNQEQVAFITLIISTVFFIHYYFTRKKTPVYSLLLTIIGAISVVVIIACPGNQERIATDIALFCPDWNTLHFYDKIFIAIQATSSALLKNTYIIGTAILVSVVVGLKNKGIKWYSILIVSFYATLIIIRFVCNITGTIILPLYAYNTFVADLYNPFFQSFMLFCVHFAALFAYPFFMWKLLGNKALIPTFIILVGIASRLIVGFSPTFFASGERTMIFLYFALLYSVLYISTLFIENKEHSL